jgi:hypothetical protein
MVSLSLIAPEPRSQVEGALDGIRRRDPFGCVTAD